MYKSKFELSKIGSGFKIAETPIIKKILKILDPTTFPIAISDFFFKEATTDVARSGKYVPTAITVNPINDELISNHLAIKTAPSTINFPPTNKPKTPNNI